MLVISMSVSGTFRGLGLCPFICAVERDRGGHVDRDRGRETQEEMGREPQREERQRGTNKPQKREKRGKGRLEEEHPAQGNLQKGSPSPLASLPAPTLPQPHPHPCQSLHTQSPLLPQGLHARQGYTAISTEPVIVWSILMTKTTN